MPDDPVGDLVSVEDAEHAARRVLPAEVWDFTAGGSGRELTLAANRAAFERTYITPRVLEDVSACSTECTVLGRRMALPAATAPMAYQSLVHPDGELAAAAAAKAAGIPFTVATLSGVPVEEVTALGGEVWFQLYWLRDWEQSLALVRRAEAAGCTAVMLTVDVPWMGRRQRDIRNRFVLPDSVHAAHLSDGPTTAAHHRPAVGSAVAAHTAATLSASLTWSDLERLRAATTLTLIVKGITAPRDAARIRDCGADAVVVSNHGGRQLDGTVPSLVALPEVVAAVGDGCEVLLDSGVRSGTDILKALALGARAVLVGRPLLWGLALGGQAGARKVLDLLAGEFKDALGLAGCADVEMARNNLHTRPLFDPAR